VYLFQALSLISCKQSTISGIYFVNSAQEHLVIYLSNDILIKNMHITAPENSPNTDGIHIEASQNVLVNNSYIATGKKFCQFCSIKLINMRPICSNNSILL